MPDKPDRPAKPIKTIRIKPSSYQPTKAELEEVIILRNPDGSRATPEQVARAVLEPVNIIIDPDA